MKRTMFAWLLLAGACVAGWGLAAGQPAAAPPADPTAGAKTDESPSPAPVVLDNARTKPSRRIDLALRVPGVLATRPVAVGDRVKAGQLLAELDSDLETADLDMTQLEAESEHELRAAIMSEKQSQVELERIKFLFEEKKAATEWELKEAQVKAGIATVRTEYATYQRRLAALKLARGRIALAKRRLIATFDGVIQKTYKEVGEAVAESTPILQLLQLAPLWVVADAPEKHFGRILPGQPALVTVGQRQRQARVLTVAPSVDASSGTFEVALELANDDSAFPAGVPARVEFKPMESAAATAPDSPAMP